jgi:hypothetical protein
MVQFEYDYAACRRQALISGVVRPFHCSKFQVFRVLPDGCFSKRQQSTTRAPPWPTCGPLRRANSAPTSTRRSPSRTWPETRRRARCDRPSQQDRGTQRPARMTPHGRGRRPPPRETRTTAHRARPPGRGAVPAPDHARQRRVSPPRRSAAARGSRPRKRSSWSGSAGWPGATPISCPAVSSNASHWPAPWPASPAARPGPPPC